MSQAVETEFSSPPPQRTAEEKAYIRAELLKGLASGPSEPMDFDAFEKEMEAIYDEELQKG